MSESKAVELIKLISNFIQKSNGFESKVLKQLKFVSAGGGNCLAELKVGPDHLNRAGGLHGGVMATLVDAVTTYALMTDERSGIRAGVSVDIHVSYLKGAKEGDDILIDARTIKAGRTLAFLEVELKDKIKGHIIAKGRHTKFVGQVIIPK